MTTVSDAQLVALWLSEYAADRLAPTTVTSYRDYVQRLARWADRPLVDLVDLVALDLRRWLAEAGADWKPSTRCVAVPAVKSLYRRAATERILDEDPAAGLRFPSQDEPPVRVGRRRRARRSGRRGDIEAGQGDRRGAVR